MKNNFMAVLSALGGLKIVFSRFVPRLQAECEQNENLPPGSVPETVGFGANGG